MKRKIITISTSLFIIILVKFWVGIYEQDEFHSYSIFVKHRPIWKTYFYSPRGMSDLKLLDMTDEKRKEQELFDEFILNKNETK